MRGVKLGFWNRLALVVGVLALFIIPTWDVVNSNSEMAEHRISGHATCLGFADSSAAIKHCDETFLTDLGDKGWGYWKIAFVNTAGGLAILYLLIWVIVATAKWIWRGRDNANAG